MNNPIRVAVVDHRAIFRAGVLMILRTDPTVEIVAEGQSTEDAHKIADEVQPDLILLDIKSHRAGIDTVSAIKSLTSATNIVILTDIVRDDIVHAAFAAGVRGYVLKDADAAELLRAIHIVSSGQTYITPTFAANLLVGSQKPPTFANAPTILTPRQEEVFQSVGQGKSNKEIARTFGLSEKTVKHHMTNIMEKLCVRNRVEVALCAAELDFPHSHLPLTARPRFTSASFG
jgi:two-component system, NarL family, nitrate/nitrite response regulator NarL